jgi:hypothetical protein
MDKIKNFFSSGFFAVSPDSIIGKQNAAKAATGQPKENDTKTNSAGDPVIYKGGRWQPNPSPSTH